MGTIHRPRWGSLQFWPRKKAEKEVPSVNWKALYNSPAKNHLLGFICYKVGMQSVLVKDNTPNSMTKGKSIVVPVTVLECPALKVFSVRLYKNNQVVGEILSSSFEKEIKRRMKMPKNAKNEERDFDDARIIAYSLVKRTEIKKSPDIMEIGLKGSAQEKLEFAKSILNREINFDEFFDKNQLIAFMLSRRERGFQGLSRDLESR